MQTRVMHMSHQLYLKGVDHKTFDSKDKDILLIRSQVRGPPDSTH
jgi:hypothetical protein